MSPTPSTHVTISVPLSALETMLKMQGQRAGKWPVGLLVRRYLLHAVAQDAAMLAVLERSKLTDVNAEQARMYQEYLAARRENDE